MSHQIKDITKMSNAEIKAYYIALHKLPISATVETALMQILRKANKDAALSALINEADNELAPLIKRWIDEM